MRKKLLAAVLCAAVLGMTACGAKEENTRQEQTDSVQEEETQKQDETESAPSEEAQKQDGAEEVQKTETETQESVQKQDEAADSYEENRKSMEAAGIIEFETASEAVDNMLIGWNLGNSFDATGEWITTGTAGANRDFETAWGNPVTEKSTIHKIKELGFGAIRIPVTWRYHFDENGEINEEWMARVQEVVDWAMEEELYCIINVHHDTGSDGWLRASEANYEENKALFAKLWTQIAERFVEYPETLLFEGFNEMLDENSEWNSPKQDAIEAINLYNQCFVDTVRATGGKNLTRNLVCCTYAAATTGSVLSGFQVPEDFLENHLIAEFHFYAPYEFVTEEGVTWTTPLSEYSDYVEKTIDDTLMRVKNKLGAKGVPVIIGEFATDDKENTQDRILWYTHVVQKANEQNITCFVWDNGHGYCMGHIDRTGDADDFPEIIQACVETAR